MSDRYFFPMRPINGGTLDAATVRASHVYQDKLDGHRALVQRSSGKVFSRHDGTLSCASLLGPDVVKQLLAAYPESIEWFDCEALVRFPNGKGSLVVLDVLDGEARTQAERRQQVLAAGLPLADGPVLPSNSVLVVAEWPASMALERWNQTRQFGQPFEGLVSKNPESYYVRQNWKENREYASWIKHRF